MDGSKSFFRKDFLIFKMAKNIWKHKIFFFINLPLPVNTFHKVKYWKHIRTWVSEMTHLRNEKSKMKNLCRPLHDIYPICFVVFRKFVLMFLRTVYISDNKYLFPENVRKVMRKLIWINCGFQTSDEKWEVEENSWMFNILISERK